MSPEGKRRHYLGAGVLMLCMLSLAGLRVDAANAAGPPVLGAAWVSDVFSGSARLNAEINPSSLPTTYHFDYITKALYDANLAAAKDGFSGALRTPTPTDGSVGSGSGLVLVQRTLFALSPDTAYRYRVVAKNSAATVTGPTLGYATHPLPSSAFLPDGRGWEMVSPADKNGGRIDPPGTLAGGGVLRAAASSAAVTYGSAASFGEGPPGAPPASQYIATRGTGAWSTQNISAALFSGSYGAEPDGVPYQLFSPELDLGLLLNGSHCRGEVGDCAVANPPLAGTDAPAGYQNYYLRGSSGGFEALLSAADIAGRDLDPASFELSLAGASPDLSHVVLSTCAALTTDASDGCGAEEANLYITSPPGGLDLLNFRPGDGIGTPGAALASKAGAVSADGLRIYFTLDGDLYLRVGAETNQVDVDAGGGGVFQDASTDGSVAFFTKGGHLWRYLAATETATDLTPEGGVVGVLGASGSGGRVYFQDAGALKLWQAGATSTVAVGAGAAAAGNWPPATGTARVSADGNYLLFASEASLSGYDNTELGAAGPVTELFLYEASIDSLTCVSCNPTGGRPLGPSSVPGSIPNGTSPAATNSYKPRVLTANGHRVFFDSEDALSLTDTNEDSDVYQWEPEGTGSCARMGGCIALISSGRAANGASFVDASADGADAFFLTDESLVKSDPGATDLYDARIGGGFLEPQSSIPCEGDACQILPPEPSEPTLTTLLAGLGNPPVRYRRYERGAKSRCSGGQRLKTVAKKNGKRVKRCIRQKHGSQR